MKLAVIDGQGGNVGKQMIRSIRESYPDVFIRCVGTNSIATGNMLKAGADEGATGENAVVVAARDADIIVGPIGLIVADALLGEVTEKMAVAIGRSSAKKVLIPLNKCDLFVAGTIDRNTGELLSEATKTVCAIIKGISQEEKR